MGLPGRQAARNRKDLLSYRPCTDVFGTLHPNDGVRPSCACAM